MAVWMILFAALDKLDNATRIQHFPNVMKWEKYAFFCSNEYATSKWRRYSYIKFSHHDSTLARAYCPTRSQGGPRGHVPPLQISMLRSLINGFFNLHSFCFTSLSPIHCLLPKSKCFIVTLQRLFFVDNVVAVSLADKYDVFRLRFKRLEDWFFILIWSFKCACVRVSSFYLRLVRQVSRFVCHVSAWGIGLRIVFHICDAR